MEEQTSRDFGPLLARMGVVDERGQSAMDENQWEAASESHSPPTEPSVSFALKTLMVLDLYMTFAFEKIRDK